MVSNPLQLLFGGGGKTTAMAEALNSLGYERSVAIAAAELQELSRLLSAEVQGEASAEQRNQKMADVLVLLALLTHLYNNRDELHQRVLTKMFRAFPGPVGTA